MTTLPINDLLTLTLIMYVIIIIIAYLLNIKLLYMVGGLLWLIPITQVNNTFIILVSSIMFLVHAVMTLTNKKESEF